MLHIKKKELVLLSHVNLVKEFQQRLDFIKSIDIFKKLTAFSLLPITNNLVRKRFKLGEIILFRGEVPQGLYLIKYGACKVGIDQIKPLKSSSREVKHAANGE